MCGIALICYTKGGSGNPERTTMKNYFEEIGFSKEVPEVILDCTIYAWSKFDISIRPELYSEYFIIGTSNSDESIQFELLTGVELYFIKFDGNLEICRAGKKLNKNTMIPVDVAMYIFVEMRKHINNYRKIANVYERYGKSEFFGKMPVYLVGWMADLVCWKDKSYTLSEANCGDAFKSVTKDSTIVIKFAVDDAKYRLLYDIDNDYEEIVLKVDRKKVDVIDNDLANLIIIKLSECFRELLNNVEKAGIVCNV